MSEEESDGVLDKFVVDVQQSELPVWEHRLMVDLGSKGSQPVMTARLIDGFTISR